MTSHRWAALFFLTMSVAYGVVASDLETGSAGAQSAWSARTFPLILAGAGGLLSLLLLFAPTASEPEWSGDWSRALLLCGLISLYAFALPRLGFSLPTVAFLAAGFRTLGERRKRLLLLVPLPPPSSRSTC